MRAVLTWVSIGGVALAAAMLWVRAPAGAQTPPAGYAHFTSAVRLWIDGAQVVIQADAVPDHKSPYFPTTDPRWEAYNGTNPNWQQNPNHIAEQTIEFHIPLDPQEASTHQPTPLGPIGVAVNGVPLFNQYAGPNQPLTNEVNSFDQYDGHPQMTNMYHYHVEPYALTAVNGKDSLIGYLLDGFPVYGPEEDGQTITNADLDQYHGHFGATADYPQGIYHYHVTAEAPYINGAGFYGTPGTVIYAFSPTPTPTASSTPTATAVPTVVASVGGHAAPPDAVASGDGSSGTVGAIAAAGAVIAAMAGAWFVVRRRSAR
jgi:hypothetical protein